MKLKKILAISIGIGTFSLICLALFRIDWIIGVIASDIALTMTAVILTLKYALDRYHRLGYYNYGRHNNTLGDFAIVFVVLCYTPFLWLFILGIIWVSMLSLGVDTAIIYTIINIIFALAFSIVAFSILYTFYNEKPLTEDAFDAGRPAPNSLKRTGTANPPWINMLIGILIGAAFLLYGIHALAMTNTQIPPSSPLEYSGYYNIFVTAMVVFAAYSIGTVFIFIGLSAMADAKNRNNKGYQDHRDKLKMKITTILVLTVIITASLITLWYANHNAYPHDTNYIYRYCFVGFIAVVYAIFAYPGLKK